MITLSSMAGTGGPVIIARALDLVAVNPSLQAMLLAAGGVLLLGIMDWSFNYVRQMFSARVVGNVVLQLREDAFDASIQHDLSFFDEHPSGKIVSRVTSDTQDFSEVVTLTMNLLSQVLLVVILSAWLLTIDVWLTLLLVGIVAVAFPALAIAGERDRGTLEVTLSRPISRHGLYVTLFLAGMYRYSGIQLAMPKRHAVVVGGGFIGLETAENLVERGFEVTVLERGDQLLAPLDPEYAGVVNGHLRRNGVQVELGDSVAEFTKEESGRLTVRTESGKSYPADIVILALGVAGLLSLAGVVGAMLMAVYLPLIEAIGQSRI